ncbi:MAG: hypothetical protein ABL880_09585 [Methylotenera sp.]
MMIYQVIDEQNHLLFAFANLETAAQEVDILNNRSEDHRYFVNALEFDSEEL